MEPLAGQVRAVEDQVEIMQLVAQSPVVRQRPRRGHRRAVDEDGSFDAVPVWEMRGRDDIISMVHGPGHQRLIHNGCGHVLTVPHIVVDGDQATGRSYALNIRWDPEADRFWVARVSANTWTWVRTPAGWRIADRVNAPLDGTPEHREMLAPPDRKTAINQYYDITETTEDTPTAPAAERDSSLGSRTGRQLMSSLLNEDERALRDAVRSFLDRKVAPLVAEHERARTFPWELLPQLYDFGYVRGGVPEAAGGEALPMIMQAILMEEAGRCWGSLRTTLNVQGMVARVLAATADDGQSERFLQPLLAGRRFGWFGLTEPDAGSDAGALRTTARRTGDGLVVNGSKLYITNALGCDFGILFVRLTDEDGTDHGVTALLIDAAESTFGVHDIPHMPLRSTTSCELTFDDTFVPARNVLGGPGGGWWPG